MTDKSETLRLADRLASGWPALEDVNAAVLELRRLHSLNQELLEAPQRQPLTDEEIEDAYRRYEETRVLVASAWSFEVGVRWAERAHGIGENK